MGRMSQYERRKRGNALRGGAGCSLAKDTALTRVTPASGKVALGKWRALKRKHCLVAEPGSGDNLTECRAGGITMEPKGVCGRALEPRVLWEGPLGKAAAANRTREIRPSGMRGGPAET